MTRLLSWLILSLGCYVANAVKLDKALPDGVLEMPLYRIVNQTGYGIEVAIGTPPQHMKVLIDTGSPFFGVQGTKSNWCEDKTQPCKKYGSYNNLTSSTAKYLSDDFNNVLINHGFGDYIQDTVTLGGKSFTNFTFGMILDYDAGYPAPVPNAGLMGLTPLCKTVGCTKVYKTTVLQALLSRGAVKRNILGIYFGLNEPTATGSLLFGAFDKAKQRGNVVEIPAILPKHVDGSPNNFYYSSLSVRTSNATTKPETTPFKIHANSNALLDTGNPVLGLPQSAYTYTKRYFNITHPSNFDGLYPVDCKYRQQQADNATLVFGFANDTLKIDIPMRKLITQISAEKCLAPILNCGTGPSCAFGDPFFRNVYAWFDFEKYSITLSNVEYTSKTDIVVPEA